jgi:stage V sporulation protein SpoVS
MAVLRISGKTNLFNTTRAIVGMIHRHKRAEIQAIGRSAAQCAEKAIGRATAFLEDEDITIVSKTWNIMSGTDDNEKEGIRFILRVIG